MYQLGPGILPNSICVPLTATTHAQQVYDYPVLCGHYYCDSQYEVSRAHYANPLLLFVRRGALQLHCGGKDYRAEKGDVVLLDCDRPHCYRAEQQVEFLYLHFDGGHSHALVRALAAQTPLHRKEENVYIGEQLYEMIRAYARHGIENEAADSLRIYQLLIWLAMPPKSLLERDSPIGQTVKYIREHVGEQIRLQELAEMTHLSMCHYSHAFKQQTGFAPTEYIMNTRLEKAKMLLLQTTLPISEIAAEVGYESGSSLSSLFLKRVGCSPRDYRRSNGIVIK